MKAYVYVADRSEHGMASPVIRRVCGRGWWVDDWCDADIVIVPGDRREAVRFTLDAFEAGKEIWHLGSGDRCEGDFYHYDGFHRETISSYAKRSGGLLMGLHHGIVPTIGPIEIVGPTMIDDLPDTSLRPISEPYTLLCYNDMPWKKYSDTDSLAPVPKGNVYCMKPGNDGERKFIAPHLSSLGYHILRSLKRRVFLRHLRHAADVWGNSSCLCYEAPLWHDDGHIHMIGSRNKGRKIVRWDVSKDGCPSDNVIKLLEKRT